MLTANQSALGEKYLIMLPAACSEELCVAANGKCNKAVIDRRLRPRCCHLESYFKHTSFSYHYIHRDITPAADVPSSYRSKSPRHW